MIRIDTRIAKAYLVAKRYVIEKGFASEIDWQDSISLRSVNEEVFLKEYAWVVLASGMSDKVISKIFPKIQSHFRNWKNLNHVVENRTEIMNSCLADFNNKRKIVAIIDTCEYVNTYGINHVKHLVLEKGVEYLKTFPFIGDATCYHLAKNLGFNYAKPDRHLVRVSNSLGYQNPHDLCEAISKQVADKVQVVDLVIWRYATLDKDYLNKIWRLTLGRSADA